MKKLLFIGVLFLISSCAVSVKNIDPKQRNFDDIPLNVELTKEIGERMVLKVFEEYREAFLITSRPSKITINTIDFPYSTGTVLPLSGETDKYKLYFLKDDSNVGTGGVFYSGVAVDKSSGEILPFLNTSQGAMGGIYTKHVDGFSVEKTTYTEPNCPICFKQEFIYNGRVGSHLKFIYREYSNDMARPAFNQDLQYDLDESTTIGFKGVRIEVIKATNTNITYKLLSSFK